MSNAVVHVEEGQFLTKRVSNNVNNNNKNKKYDDELASFSTKLG